MDNIQSARIARLRRRNIRANSNFRRQNVRRSLPDNSTFNGNMFPAQPFITNTFGVPRKNTQNIVSKSIVNEDGSVITRTSLENSISKGSYMTYDSGYTIETITNPSERRNATNISG